MSAAARQSGQSWGSTSKASPSSGSATSGMGAGVAGTKRPLGVTSRRVEPGRRRAGFTQKRVGGRRPAAGGYGSGGEGVADLLGDLHQDVEHRVHEGPDERVRP